MKRFIVPALPDETSEEEDVYELTHIDHLSIRDAVPFSATQAVE